MSVCKKLLDDLRVMKASLFEIVRLSTRYRIQFSHLINRAIRVIFFVYTIYYCVLRISVIHEFGDSNWMTARPRSILGGTHTVV